MSLDQLKNIQTDYGPGSGRTKILSPDLWHLSTGIEEANRLLAPPPLVWNDAGSVKVLATPDSPADLLMSGFPNILQPGHRLLAGLSDGHFRRRTSQVVLNLSTDRWGAEKASQWDMVYALAANDDTDFFLKAMPMMRVKSQASQVISLGTITTPGTGIGYGFATDELAGGYIYVLTGGGRGLMREISANNGDNGTGGTITYIGTSLTLAGSATHPNPPADWFVVLPPATNFHLLGTFFNDASQNIINIRRLGNIVQWMDTIPVTASGTGAVVEDPRIACPLAVAANVEISPTGEIGHPDLPASLGSRSGQSRNGGNTPGCVNFNLEFCRYYSYGSSFFSNFYSYPEGYF